jgi:hypothetical protein
MKDDITSHYQKERTIAFALPSRERPCLSWVKSAAPFNRRLPVNFRYAPFATGSRGAALCREGPDSEVMTLIGSCRVWLSGRPPAGITVFDFGPNLEASQPGEPSLI